MRKSILFLAFVVIMINSVKSLFSQPAPPPPTEAPQIYIKAYINMPSSDTDHVAINFNTSATEGYEKCCDLIKEMIFKPDYCNIYAITPEYNLTVDALPDLETTRKVNLGFSVPSSGNFTFKASRISDFKFGVNIYLVDSTASGVTKQDLMLNRTYSFDFEKNEADSASRFYLLFDVSAKCKGFSMIANAACATCYNCSDGSAWVNVKGGVTPYTFTWFATPFQTTDTAFGLSYGTYHVIVKDYIGCTLHDSVTVNIGACSAHFDLFPTSTPHTYKAINKASGVAPLKYLWSWGDGKYDTIAYPTHTYDTAGYYKICQTVTDFAGCTNIYCYSYNLTKSNKSDSSIIKVIVTPFITDIDDNISNSQIYLYPIPANNSIVVEYPEFIVNDKSLLELYSIEGKLMKTMIVKENSTKLNIEELPKGIYMIKVSDSRNVIVKRMIKN